jgi:MFS family permease
MAIRNRHIQQEEPKVVKVDPFLSRLRKVRLVLLVSIALMLVGLIASFIASRFGDSHLNLPPLFFLNAFLIVMSSILTIIINMKQIRFWKRLEQRRQAAAKADHSLLAAEQPVPDAIALPLPTTIGQRPKWVTFLLIPGIMLLIMLIAVIAFVVFLPHLLPPLPHHRALPHNFLFIVVGISAILIFLYCGLIFGILYAKVRQQLTVTEHGLIMVGLLPKVHSVSWQEARLFAINGMYGAKKYPYPSIYELSSANDVIRWSWMRRNSARALFFAQPTLPTEEYEKQMQALLSLIAARSGLPLYDLR